MDKNANPFSGPLFVVGSARSGTKLLRDLLNRNPMINLCDHETHFIPYLYEKHRTSVPVRDARALDELFNDYDRTPFQVFLRQKGEKHMRRDDFDALMGSQTWSDVLERIVRFHSKKEVPEGSIWGDKTPSYLTEMPALKAIFPTARFVHIIRDPRDVALSSQSAFGHNLFRVASKWAKGVSIGLRDGAALGDEYLEVFYEDLVREPARELRRICDFAGCPFSDDMTTLLKPSENLGDAKGMTAIVANNVSKYREKMTPHELRRVEEIVFPAARSLRYQLEMGERHAPMSSVELAYSTLIDGAKSAIRNCRRFGLASGLRISLGNRIQKLRRR